MAVGGFDLKDIDFSQLQTEVLGAAAVTALVLLFSAYCLCCRSKRTPAKNATPKKKAKNGDKVPDSGKSAPVSNQSEKSAPLSGQSEGSKKKKGNAKEEATHDDKKAAKREQKKLALKQAEERIRAEMDQGKKGGAGGAKNGKKSKFDEQQEAERQKEMEEKNKDMFEKAQQRLKKAAAADVKVSRGGFGAFADSDSD